MEIRQARTISCFHSRFQVECLQIAQLRIVPGDRKLSGVDRLKSQTAIDLALWADRKIQFSNSQKRSYCSPMILRHSGSNAYVESNNQ